MNKMSIKIKLQLIVLMTVVVTAVSLLAVSYVSLNSFSSDDIKNYKEDITQSKVENIKDATKFAVQIVKSYHDNIEHYGNEFLKQKMEILLNELNNTYKKHKDNLSNDEMKKLLMDIVQGARYGKSGYFWINDLTTRWSCILLKRH